MSLLEVRNLDVRFDTPDGEVHAVRNLSFDLDRGETLGVVGRVGFRQEPDRAEPDGAPGRQRARQRYGVCLTVRTCWGFPSASCGASAGAGSR